MTLIELMVSITIGLILLTGLAALFAQQSSTQQELEKSSRQIENGRYAIQLLQEDLQLAGYYGEFSGVSGLAVPAALPDPCAVTAADLEAALPFAVQGYDSPSTLPTALTACPLTTGGVLSAANYLPGTDILVVRRVDTAVMGATLKAGEVYFQSGLEPPNRLSFAKVLQVSASTTMNTSTFTLEMKDPADTTPPPSYIAAPLRRYLVHIYFVSPCSVPANGSTCSSTNTDDGGVSIPTLKRLELSVAGGSAKFLLEPLVEGIENMQIDYGFDASGDDGAPDSYARAPAAVGDWANVVALRLNLLARNNERSNDYQDKKVYSLGLEGAAATTAGATTAPSGTTVTWTLTDNKFKRRVFSQLVRLVNPSARRESP